MFNVEISRCEHIKGDELLPEQKWFYQNQPFQEQSNTEAVQHLA